MTLIRIRHEIVRNEEHAAAGNELFPPHLVGKCSVPCEVHCATLTSYVGLMPKGNVAGSTADRNLPSCNRHTPECIRKLQSGKLLLVHPLDGGGALGRVPGQSEKKIVQAPMGQFHMIETDSRHTRSGTITAGNAAVSSSDDCLTSLKPVNRDLNGVAAWSGEMWTCELLRGLSPEHVSRRCASGTAQKELLFIKQLRLSLNLNRFHVLST